MNKLQITIQKDLIKAEQLPWNPKVYAYPIRLIASSNLDLENSQNTETGNFPANIFCFQLSGTGLDPNKGDTFIQIATVNDLYELPTESNISDLLEGDKGYPFYRSNALTLFVKSQEEAEEFLTYLREDIASFIESYNAGLDLDANLNIESEKIVIESNSIFKQNIY